MAAQAAIAAAVIAPIVGGMVGNWMSSKDRKAAQQALQRGMYELEAIGMPPDLSKRIIFQEFQQMGVLTPELEQDIDLAESQVSLITEDPELRDAQMDALRGIQERGRVGLGPEERLALSEIRSEIGAETEAKRQQILQNFAARGQGGSGAEFIAAMQASQAGAEEASRAGDRLGAMASQSALQALSEGGRLSGQIRQQDFGVAQAKGEAADRFSLAEFNAANQRQARNIGALNQAQAANLAQTQKTADMNVAQENQERLRMEQAKRDYWQDRLARASAFAGVGGQAARGYNQAAQQQAQMWQGIGTGIGSGFGAYGSYQMKSEEADKQRAHQSDLYEKYYS